MERGEREVLDLPLPREGETARLAGDGLYAEDFHRFSAKASSPSCSGRVAHPYGCPYEEEEDSSAAPNEALGFEASIDGDSVEGDAHLRQCSSAFPGVVIAAAVSHASQRPATSDGSGGGSASPDRDSPTGDETRSFFAAPVASPGRYPLSETAHAPVGVRVTASSGTGVTRQQERGEHPPESCPSPQLHQPGFCASVGALKGQSATASHDSHMHINPGFTAQHPPATFSSSVVAPCLYGHPCETGCPGAAAVSSHAVYAMECASEWKHDSFAPVALGVDETEFAHVAPGARIPAASDSYGARRSSWRTRGGGHAREAGLVTRVSSRETDFGVEGPSSRREISAARAAAATVARVALRVAARVATVGETLHGHWRRLTRSPGGFNGVESGDDDEEEEFNAETDGMTSDDSQGYPSQQKGGAGRRGEKGNGGVGSGRGRRPIFSKKGGDWTALGDSEEAQTPLGSESTKYEVWKCIGVEQTIAGAHPRENQRLCSLVFALIFLLEVFVNFDCGAVPASLSQIAVDFRLSTTWQGLVGALPYVGLTLASPCVGRLLAVYHPKLVIISTMALNVVAMLLLIVTYALPSSMHSLPADATHSPSEDEASSTLTTVLDVAASPSSGEEGSRYLFSSLPSFPSFNVHDLSPSAWLLLSSRFFVGLTQAAFVIYAPVWVDEFAPPQYAALWMGIVQGAAVVGVTIGYLVTAFLCIYLLLDWRWAFLLQAVVVLALVAAIWELPSESIDASSKLHAAEQDEDEDNELGEAELVAGALTAREDEASAASPRLKSVVASGRSPDAAREASRSAALRQAAAAAASESCAARELTPQFPLGGYHAQPTHELSYTAEADVDWMHDSDDEQESYRGSSGGAEKKTAFVGERSGGRSAGVPGSSSRRDRLRTGDALGRNSRSATGGKGQLGNAARTLCSSGGGTAYSELELPQGMAAIYAQHGSNDAAKQRFGAIRPSGVSTCEDLRHSGSIRVLMVAEQDALRDRDDAGRSPRSTEARASQRTKRNRPAGKALTTWAMMKRLASNPLYILPVFTLSALLFVVTGVQFWGTVHLTSNLQLAPSIAMLAFAAVAASAPTAGVIGGGIMVDRLGGYKTIDAKVKTLHACLAAAAAAVFFGFMGAMTTDALTFVLSLWFLLCFGAALLPPLTGLQIASVDTALRTFASGLSMFTYNICGYALGTFLPGAVMDFAQQGDVVGMRLILFWSLFGLVGVLVTTLFARRMREQLPVVGSSSATPHQEASATPTFAVSGISNGREDV
ncbi:transporter, major facilitator family protein [Besnoitia besnoiti]|uniref:Transporter, major facilitator family protein n=1 Tax=Besnoitia besnoiti TaxID=94643 RepID=A0A2A9ML72_BESBE|nr:transporter, major facilitator family protein [Besnoitia besnoiti]PFH38719.1 transporter, major facilitator family protein [Besnoitia besnoiti]